MKKFTFAIIWVIFISIMATLAINYSYPIKYKSTVTNNAIKFKIDEALVYSIIKAESSFKSYQISSKNAVGLMQILPSTASYIMDKNISSEDLMKIETNIEVGCKYLRYLFDKFYDIDVVICAYNAGEGNVRKWLNSKEYSLNGKNLYKIPFKETDNYLKKVKSAYKFYEKKLNKI